MSRGRRGGRRQRRREEQSRQAAAQAGNGPQPSPTNGESGAGHAVLAATPAPSPAAAAEQEHPRPMSARELVARLEAMRADAAHAHAAESPAMPQLHGESNTAEARPIVSEAPRRFIADGAEWLARTAGRGTGGTGRVAPARVHAIHFSKAAEPEVIAAEVLVPRAQLDDLYDEELAELLARGLRSRTAHG